MLKTLLGIGGLQLATMVVMLARTKILAVFLGPGGVGLLGVVDKLLAVVVQGVSLSLPFAAIRFLPELSQTDRSEGYRTLRSMALTLAALVFAAATTGAVVSLLFPAVWGPQFKAYPWLLAAGFLSIPALAFAPFIQNAFAGILQHRSAMLFGLGHAGVLALAGLIGAAAGSVAVLYLSYAALAGIWLVPAMHRLIRALRPSPVPPLAGWRDVLPSRRILRFSAAMFLLAVLAPFAALNAHYQVLRQAGVEAAGWMQAAIGISLAVRSVLGAAHPIYLTPQLNKGGSWQERMRWAARFQHLWCILAAVLVPPLLIGADLAIAVLYSKSFLPATQYVALFVFAEVLTMQAGIYQGLIVAADRIRFHVAQNLASQVVFIAVSWLTIPRFGIAGAAFGAIASQAFIFVCTLSYLKVKMDLMPPLRITALMMYVLLGMGGLGWLGADGLVLHGTGGATALAAFGAFLAGLSLFLTREDRDGFRTWTSRLVRRRQ
ncbi:MAG: polysaccharide biosynthesis C-terminal domain-containing protein [Caldimonas sp.]